MLYGYHDKEIKYWMGSDIGCASFAQFFEKAASNVKENIGEDVQTDQLIREACRNCLEHVSKLHFFN